MGLKEQEMPALKIPLTLLMGPFFFSAAISFFLIKESRVSLWAIAIALLGLGSSWRWQKSGLIFSCLFQIATLSYWAIAKDLTLWDLELSLSFFLSWSITYLAISRFETTLASTYFSKEEHIKEISRQKHSFEFTEKSLKEKLEKLSLEKKYLEESVNTQKVNQQALRDQLITAHQETKLLKIESSSDDNAYQRAYFLLKKQFEEKSEALQKLRSEFFKLEHELLILKKEKEEASYHDDHLMQSMGQVIKSHAEISDENKKLHELLDSMLKIKKQRYARLKPLKRKKGETSLFDEVS